MQKTIRSQCRRRRSAMHPSERHKASEKIAESVIHSCWFQRSGTIACYLSVPGEVETWRIIARAWRMKKRVFAPVVEKNGLMRFREITAESTLIANVQGIYEPRDGDFIEPRLLDVVLAPLVAFDKNNNRIGMGGGYFDRTFSFLSHRTTFFRPKLIGLAFACQNVEKISPNPWDIRLFSVLTELS
jgi:5-formyltetrahydrofolate cyclo-ligase